MTEPVSRQATILDRIVDKVEEADAVSAIKEIINGCQDGITKFEGWSFPELLKLISAQTQKFANEDKYPCGSLASKLQRLNKILKNVDSILEGESFVIERAMDKLLEQPGLASEFIRILEEIFKTQGKELHEVITPQFSQMEDRHFTATRDRLRIFFCIQAFCTSETIKVAQDLFKWAALKIPLDYVNSRNEKNFIANHNFYGVREVTQLLKKISCDMILSSKEGYKTMESIKSFLDNSQSPGPSLLVNRKPLGKQIRK